MPSNTTKATKVAQLPPFAGIYGGLSALFTKIKNAGVNGAPLVDPVSKKTLPGTKEGAAAYGDAWKAAQTQVKGVVSKLSSTDLDYVWKGLELSSAADKHGDDVTNSVLSTWDAAASKYMKNDGGADSEAGKLKPRLDEFDTALSSQGATPVKKDE